MYKQTYSKCRSCVTGIHAVSNKRFFFLFRLRIYLLKITKSTNIDFDYFIYLRYHSL